MQQDKTLIMKQEYNKTQLAYFDLCRLLKDSGYREGSDKFLVIYDEDYVYDEDPNHPESHRKGEMRVYDRYFKNCQEVPNSYELPTLEKINDWLLKEKGAYICITIANKRYFDYDIYVKVNSLTFDKYELLMHSGNKCTTPDDAYITAFIYILNFLKQLENLKQE